MEQRFRFPKSHRLKRRRDLESLMQGGKSFHMFPLRAVYRFADTAGSQPVCMAVSVPKRLFKSAVDRNLLKRRIREAYRLNLGGIFTQKPAGRTIHLLLVYTGKEKVAFDLIQSKIILILRRLHTIHEQDSVTDTVRPPDSV